MSQEPLLPQEPSVLDYLKEVAKNLLPSWVAKNLLPFWVAKNLLPFWAKDFSPIHRGPQAAQPSQTVIEHGPQFPSEGAGGWFWPLLTLVAGLVAQWFLEPPHLSVPLVAIVLYLLAVLGFIRVLHSPTPFTGQALAGNAVVTLEPFTFRQRFLLFSLVFALLAFLSFQGNRFTWLNLTFWGLAILFYLIALWSFTGDGWLQRLGSRVRAPEWTFRLRREHLFLILGLGVAIFYRLHHLSVTPAEPFSDHAEKILDIYDITQGQWSIFFPRNTGREGFQMYWTLLVAKLFGTGLSFQSLKLGTALLGILTLPYLYLLGCELGNRRTGWLTLFLGGIAFWPNIISRIGLRFPLYPLFTTITLYYLVRGLRRGGRNDFLLSGLFLGLGLHGYTPFRIVPFLVVVAFALYVWHVRTPSPQVARRQAMLGLLLIASTALLIFLPLLRYALENPQMFAYRAFSRLTPMENNLPAPWPWVFLRNVLHALLMFHWDDGNIWVVSIPHRPALDLVGAVFLLFGIVFLLWRYARQRHWEDLFLLIAIPILQLPSTLSLAFPDENPAPNRAAGAYGVVFLIVALGMDAFLRRLEEQGRPRLAQAILTVLLLLSLVQNYSLTFETFDRQYRAGTWNSSEMGAVLKQFLLLRGNEEGFWIVPYPYWVDTRLPGVWAGIPNRDFALWPEQLESSLSVPPPKMFLYHPDDLRSAETLRRLYPQGIVRRFPSATENHDFYIFFVP